MRVSRIVFFKKGGNCKKKTTTNAITIDRGIPCANKMSEPTPPPTPICPVCRRSPSSASSCCCPWIPSAVVRTSRELAQVPSAFLSCVGSPFVFFGGGVGAGVGFRAGVRVRDEFARDLWWYEVTGDVSRKCECIFLNLNLFILHRGTQLILIPLRDHLLLGQRRVHHFHTRDG